MRLKVIPYSLLLLGHKANKFFEGSTLQFMQFDSSIAPFLFFIRYLSLHNQHFRWFPKLWLLDSGSPPTLWDSGVTVKQLVGIGKWDLALLGGI